MGLVLVAVVEVPGQAGRRRRAHPHRRRPQRRSPTSCAPPGSRPSAARAHNTRITLSVAFNYGGRWDIVQACRQAIAAGVPPERARRGDAERATWRCSYAPDPDLFIRTGGEVRISNFLLWQVAYSELVFTDCLWPDFGERRARRGAGRSTPAASAASARVPSAAELGRRGQT